MHRTLLAALLALGPLTACKGSSGDDTAAGSSSDTTDPGTTSVSSQPSTTAPDPTTGETTATGGTLSATGTEGNTLTTDPPTSTGPTTGEALTTDMTSTTTSMTTGETTTGGTTTDMTTGGTTDGNNGPCVPLACEGAIYDCGDCMDNDGDGKIDTADPECISPCDDQEMTFATGLPGDNMDPCKQDCFFDGNSGGGPGDCAWNLKCDPESPGGDKCPYDPGFMNCPMEQTDECVMNCQVPNGCDCFGCCSVQVDGMNYDIYLGDPDCSLANIATCSTCSKNDDCDDECVPENCEVCFGQELPPECEEASCDAGEIPCEVDDMGGSNCPADMYCNTGCCAPLVPN